jgi:hypothetical protein
MQLQHERVALLPHHQLDRRAQLVARAVRDPVHLLEDAQRLPHPRLQHRLDVLRAAPRLSRRTPSLGAENRVAAVWDCNENTRPPPGDRGRKGGKERHLVDGIIDLRRRGHEAGREPRAGRRAGRRPRAPRVLGGSSIKFSAVTLSVTLSYSPPTTLR